MQEIERSAPSVEEAIEAALAELGVSEQEASVQIVQEPRSGGLLNQRLQCLDRCGDPAEICGHLRDCVRLKILQVAALHRTNQ